MNVVYQLRGNEFEWDSNKAESNIAKHSVTFEEAAEVFFDPLSVLGDGSANNEPRYCIIWYSLASRLLLTVYVERDQRTRLISARLATKAERRLYENP